VISTATAPQTRPRTVLARSIAAEPPRLGVTRDDPASGSAGTLLTHAPSAAMAIATTSQVLAVRRSRDTSRVTRPTFEALGRHLEHGAPAPAAAR